jgi:hypothetical protein
MIADWTGTFSHIFLSLTTSLVPIADLDYPVAPPPPLCTRRPFHDFGHFAQSTMYVVVLPKPERYTIKFPAKAHP